MMSDKFYITTSSGEKELAAMLKNSPEHVVACRKRLAELDDLLKHGEDRCHISREQRDFLRRMLKPYSDE